MKDLKDDFLNFLQKKKLVPQNTEARIEKKFTKKLWLFILLGVSITIPLIYMAMGSFIDSQDDIYPAHFVASIFTMLLTLIFLKALNLHLKNAKESVFWKNRFLIVRETERDLVRRINEISEVNHIRKQSLIDGLQNTMDPDPYLAFLKAELPDLKLLLRSPKSDHLEEMLKLVRDFKDRMLSDHYNTQRKADYRYL